MPTPEQKQALLDAISQIRLAEQVLVEQSRAETDTARLIKINTEYTHLDSYLSQLVHAQALADDAEFTAATTALKMQATALSAEQADISKVVGDVAKAAKIVGYLVKAVSLIAKL